MVGVFDTAIIAGYALSMLSAGIAFARRPENSETFFLADGTLGPFRVFGTTFSTFLGSGPRQCRFRDAVPGADDRYGTCLGLVVGS